MNEDWTFATSAAAHLAPAPWREVNRRLMAKAICELAHEDLLHPLRAGAGHADGCYRLQSGGAEYRFQARAMQLDHLHIDESTLERWVAGHREELDVMAFITEFAEELQLPAERLGAYLEELASTLYGACFKLQAEARSARELARAGFQQIEAAMTAGHPCFLANNARMGFNLADHRAYAPETAQPVSLVWLAANRARCEFGCIDSLSYEELVARELDATELTALRAELAARRLNAADYYLLPVHPWQWENRVAQLFAADLAQDDLVFLGLGRGSYVAQQSIRTLFNSSAPERCYVKTALSIVNMGFSRGLSPALASSAPAVNDWVSERVRRDAVLSELGFELLREVAFIGFRHRYYERASSKRVDPYKELLAALWRESPVPRLRAGERLMTMAALFHVDRAGQSLLIELIAASGVGVDAWLSSFLSAYLKPQLHCFFAHRLVFTPHAENVILVLDDDVVVRTIIKDIAEDIGVLNPTQELPAEVRRIALRVPEEVMTLSIFTDVFDCLFRFLSALLWQHARYPEEKFWGQVARCVHEYERSQPALRDSFRRFDLFAPTFQRNCLNRLQLTNTRMMIDLNAPDPVTSLQLRGRLQNPIARFAPTDVGSVLCQ